MDYGRKVNVSVSIPLALLDRMGRHEAASKNRSEFIVGLIEEEFRRIAATAVPPAPRYSPPSQVDGEDEG